VRFGVRIVSGEWSAGLHHVRQRRCAAKSQIAAQCPAASSGISHSRSMKKVFKAVGIFLDVRD
jgi:hypothetical protein